VLRLRASNPRTLGPLRFAALLALAPWLSACFWGDKPVELRVTPLIAVLPIERARVQSATPGEEVEAVPEDAGTAITGQIYRVLAHDSKFRFVPDLTVADAVQSAEVRNAPDLTARAHALRKEVGADLVLFGRVHRFRERVGTEFGASGPASVGFDLSVLGAGSDTPLWQGSFNQTQEPLSSNLFNWWMFWRAGPRWFTVRELAGLGVEKLIDDMKDEIEE
jgi:hypothetical protein